MINSRLLFLLSSTSRGGFSPLNLLPILALQSTRIDGYSTSLPIMKVRRSVAGDEVDIYGYNPLDPRQYQTSAGGAYVTTESLLYPAERLFVVTLYDQSGNGNHATQTTASSQPELIWEGLTFGSELVTNGDMELDSNWTGYQIEVGDINERSSVRAQTGTYSRHIVVDATDATAEGCYQDTINYENGKAYKISGYTYVESGDFVARAFDGSGITILTNTTVSTIGAWIPWEQDFFADNTTSIGHIQLISGTVAAEFYVDNVSVTEVLTWGLPQIKFDGSNDYLSCNSPVNLATPSVFAYFDFEGGDGLYQGIVSNVNNVNADGYMLQRRTNNTLWYSTGDGTYYDAKSDNIITASSPWTSFCGTFDGTTVRLYRDAVLQTITATGNIADSSDNLVIGRFFANYNGYYFNGKMNAVLIYPTALTEAQIAELNTYINGAT